MKSFLIIVSYFKLFFLKNFFSIHPQIAAVRVWAK